MADDDETEDNQDIELDENTPEHITLNSISDTVPVLLYYTLNVDQKDLDFKCGTVKFPSKLYIEETMELHAGGTSDSNDDDLMVSECFQDSQKRYIYAETAGHTPSHISIRAVDNAYMITGDAAVIEGEKLAIANPEYCLDPAAAEQSLNQLLQYNSCQYICYHGGVLKK